MFKIKELETNVTYDDVYFTIQEAVNQIKLYELDDGETRSVTYVILSDNGEKIEDIL